MNRMYQTLPSKVLLIATVITVLAAQTDAAEVESFTEPYRRVEVPAPEVGTMAQLLVKEGDAVARAQQLAKMDDSVLLASLEVARAAKEAKGSLLAAEAVVRARKKQLDSYTGLRERGNATQREIDRSENDHIQAQSQLQSVREELEVRRLEFERTKAQLKHREIRSPINGFVVSIVKEAGEFVSPTDPIVMHVVQLETLKSVFAIPLAAIDQVQVGQQVTLSVGLNQQQCQGVIEFVSPTADFQTKSVRVKIRIPNPTGEIQSGATCVWDLKGYEAPEQISRKSRPSVR